MDGVNDNNGFGKTINDDLSSVLESIRISHVWSTYPYFFQQFHCENADLSHNIVGKLEPRSKVLLWEMGQMLSVHVFFL